MKISYIVNVSDTPTKIGTLTERNYNLNFQGYIVEQNGVPTIEFDSQQAISIDRKSVQVTTVAVYERIAVTYVFPAEELYLDDEFRRSAAPYGQVITLDMTDYPWIARTLQVVLDMESVTTDLVGCGSHLRRSFNALVVG